MATLLCMFVAVGCGSDGSDGKDVEPGTVTALEQQIANLEALITQLQADGSVSAAEIQALLEDLAELRAQLAEYESGNAPIAASSSETCVTCHGDGKDYDPASHTQYVSKDKAFDAGNLDFAVNGGDIEITFSLETSTGAPFTGYTTFNTVYFLYEASAADVIAGYATTAGEIVRARIQSNGLLANALSQPTNGNYLITLAADGSGVTGDSTGTANAQGMVKLAALAALPEADRDIRMLVTFTDSNTTLTDPELYDPYYVNVSKDFGTSPRDLYDVNACASCHGEKIFDRGNNSARTSVGAVRVSTYGYHYATSNGENCSVCHSYTTKGEANKLYNYVHKVHSSSHDNKIEVKSGVFYGIGYPNDMTNCFSCHNTQDRIDAVLDEDYFTYNTCMSCHVSWDSWDFIDAGGTAIMNHTGFNASTDCLACHADSVNIAPTFDEFHGGYNLSEKHGKDFVYKIYSITVNAAGTQADVVWGVENAVGVNYNLTNSDLNVGPTFGNLTMFVAYGMGDDWTNEGLTSAQPATTNRLSAAAGVLTENATNVYNAGTSRMTTTVPVAPGANETKGAVVIHNRPSLKVGNVTLTGYTGPLVSGIAVPFDVAANGTELALRRAIVSDAKCIACHGSHSGFHGSSGRVIGTQMCAVCHNSSATEKNRRADFYGVTAETSLDGKSEESYDLKVMIHRIHSAGETDEPYILYRQQGTSIWAFLGKVLPAGWGVNPVGTNGITANFNDVEVYYPQSTKNCEACHNPGTYGLADQAEALPVTVGQGASYTTRSDDTVIGPNQAACTSCHVKSDAVGHATALGYKGKGSKAEIIKDK